VSRRRLTAGAAGLAPIPALVLALVLLSACGLSAEDTARPLQSPPVRFPSTASPVPADTTDGAVTDRIFFVRDDKLVAVTRPARTASVTDLMTQLLTGPTDTERALGLTTALPGTDVTAAVRIDGSQAVVDLTADQPSGQTGRSDEVLAIAQVVCTLTGRPDIATVVFHRDGHPVPMLRGDGTIATEPLTAADYANLTAP
jgi:hypothetical protein